MARPRSVAAAAAAPLLLLLAAAAAGLVSAASPAASDFVRKSCRTTQYPSVCEQSLASYGGSPPPRSPRELARAALSVSADRARAASAYVGRLCGASNGKGAKKGSGSGSGSASAGPVRDCLDNLADSVGHLRDAAQEMGGAGMGRAGTPAFRWHLSNVQTWCSAALTDEDTCLDGLSSRAVDAGTRAAIRGKVVEVAQVTSNALALVNKVGPGY
ncbi:ripening-related protein precursor [Zea mays]|jgi:pectinesterase inhibitor-like protein|uniref:Pectin methylesterase inhibitor 1 n=1 Tax=Zea mays TaxID=4577 RepID=C4JAK7_MAIZE|nr:ripening-related protein precursor [Zea mays]ACR38207.1 unknown [Zea mays]AQK67114.1 pectin methylesterase inhibitor 1 [Zea mays]|eukprot:NP_001183744.1 ripening-related protein precursor [Zea mays]